MGNNEYTRVSFRAWSANRIKYFLDVWVLLFDTLHYIATYNTYDTKVSRFNADSYQADRSAKADATGLKGIGIQCSNTCELYH